MTQDKNACLMLDKTWKIPISQRKYIFLIKYKINVITQPTHQIKLIPSKVIARVLYAYGSKYLRSDTKLIPERIVIAKIIISMALRFIKIRDFK